MPDIKYWVGFTMIPDIGSVRFSRLLDHFGSLEDVWNATSSELRASGLDAKSTQNIAHHRPRIELERAMDQLENFNVKVLSQNSHDYPQRIKQIYDAPPVCYILKGSP